MNIAIAMGPRVRKTPFHESTMSHGVKSFSIYNHMLMPTSYGDPVGEYEALTQRVSIWDVACERQVEIVGPDASDLVEYLSTRGMRSCKPGRARYTPICDHEGVLINDPITLSFGENRFWMSIADGDLLLWVQAVVAERKLNCRIFEPDVSPLAIQGPKADDTMSDLLGDWIRDIPFFGFSETNLEGIPFVICRSGWSGQGGFELFLTDESKGNQLWQRIWEAGTSYGIHPGAPNPSERIESDLLSYRADCAGSATPLELGLSRFMNLEREEDFVGKESLLKEKSHGPSRRLVKVSLSGEPLLSPNQEPWPALDPSGNSIGDVRVAIWSPALGENVALALINTEASGNGFSVIDFEKSNRTATHLSFFGDKS